MRATGAAEGTAALCAWFESALAAIENITKQADTEPEFGCRPCKTLLMEHEQRLLDLMARMRTNSKSSAVSSAMSPRGRRFMQEVMRPRSNQPLSKDSSKSKISRRPSLEYEVKSRRSSESSNYGLEPVRRSKSDHTVSLPPAAPSLSYLLIKRRSVISAVSVFANRLSNRLGMTKQEEAETVESARERSELEEVEQVQEIPINAEEHLNFAEEALEGQMGSIHTNVTKARGSDCESVDHAWLAMAADWMEEDTSAVTLSSICWRLSEVMRPIPLYMFCIQRLYMLAVFYQLLITPVLLGFVKVMHLNKLAVSMPEVLSEVIILMETFNTYVIGVKDEDSQRGARGMAMLQKRGAWVFVDILVCIPFHCFWMMGGSETASLALRTLTAFRLLQLPKVFLSQPPETSGFSWIIGIHPNFSRVFELLALFFYVVHLVACAYFLVAQDVAVTDSEGAVTFQHGAWWTYGIAQTDIFYEWISSYYWALSTISGIDMFPETFTEISCSLVGNIMGVCLEAGVIGSVASLLGSLDGRAAEQKVKIDEVTKYLQKNKVSKEMAEQVLQYYKYHFSSVQSSVELLKELSSPLKLRLDLAINKPFIQNCPFFSNCPLEGVVMLVEAIVRNSTIVVPTETIFKKGDSGNAMYFIVKGTVVIYDPGHETKLDRLPREWENLAKPKYGDRSEKGAMVLKTATSGDYFGELAILSESARKASAAAQKFVELRILWRSDFQKALVRFPAYAEQLQATAVQRYSMGVDVRPSAMTKLKRTMTSGVAKLSLKLSTPILSSTSGRRSMFENVLPHQPEDANEDDEEGEGSDMADRENSVVGTPQASKTASKSAAGSGSGTPAVNSVEQDNLVSSDPVDLCPMDAYQMDSYPIDSHPTEEP